MISKIKILLFLIFVSHTLVAGDCLLKEVQCTSTYTETDSMIKSHSDTEALTSNGIPKSVERRLKRDAARIALQLHSKGESLELLSINIPSDKIDLVFNKLVAIYKSEISEAKCVNNKIKVKASTNVAIDKFTLIFDNNAAWAAPLKSGVYETKNQALNDLLDEYDLRITRYNIWSEGLGAITIQSTQPYNIAALVSLFYELEAVEDIKYGGDSSEHDIRFIPMSNGWKVYYEVSWTNFKNKNIQKHTWVFEVTEDDEVLFVEEFGDSLPTWLKCMIGSGNSNL